MSDVASVNVVDVPPLVKAYVKSRLSLMIWGDRGIGKSGIVRQVGEELGWPVIDLRLATQEVADLIGIPYEKDGTTRWAKPEWFPTEEQPHGILFLDEINRAQRDVVQAVFQLVLDHKLHTHVLPQGWTVVAAGNYFGSYDVREMDEAMMSRFGHIDVETSSNAVTAFGIEHAWNAKITDFLQSNQSYVMQISAETESQKYTPQPDPRRWEMVNQFMEKGYPTFVGDNDRIQHLLRVALTGLIGDAAAMAFMTFKPHLPSFIEIINGSVTMAKLEDMKKKDTIWKHAVEKCIHECVPTLKNRDYNQKEFDRMIEFAKMAERKDAFAGAFQTLLQLQSEHKLKNVQWINELMENKYVFEMYTQLLKDKNMFPSEAAV